MDKDSRAAGPVRQPENTPAVSGDIPTRLVPGGRDTRRRRYGSGENASTATDAAGTITRMQALRVIKGDATSPQAKGPKIIDHVCNDLGGWGKGFVLAISKRWPEPERAYRDWHRERARNDFRLGATQLVQVRPDTWVANMVAQRGMRTGSKGPPIRYDAVARCLSTVADHALRLKASVHMPRIGTGIAGGQWKHIEPIIAETLLARDVPTTVYDFD